MTINLTEDLERVVLDAVRTGRYARADDVIRDALLRLRQDMEEYAEASDQSAEPGPQRKRLTKQEFQRHLVKIGLMDQVPDAHSVPDDPDQPLIVDEEEIVSEIVIRERLIEWLVGFLTK